MTRDELRRAGERATLHHLACSRCECQITWLGLLWVCPRCPRCGRRATRAELRELLREETCFRLVERWRAATLAGLAGTGGDDRIEAEELESWRSGKRKGRGGRHHSRQS